MPPSGDRLCNALHPKRARKIVAATSRHHQHWQLQPHQIAQVPMNGAISAEDENGIEDARVCRHTEYEAGSISLKRIQIFR